MKMLTGDAGRIEKGKTTPLVSYLYLSYFEQMSIYSLELTYLKSIRFIFEMKGTGQAFSTFRVFSKERVILSVL